MNEHMSTLTATLGFTGSIQAALDALDVIHRDTAAETQEAAWIDPDDFALLVAERREHGFTDYRIRRRSA